MATLDNLCANGDLEQIDVELDRGVQPWRRIFGTQEFVQWLANDLPNLDTKVIGGEFQPIEQVDALFHDYISGKPFQDDRRFKKLNRTPDGYVWEFKTVDLRLFGWIPSVDNIVLTIGDLKDDIELYNRYGAHIARTMYIREHLDLDEPKYIASDKYQDVISTSHNR